MNSYNYDRRLFIKGAAATLALTGLGASGMGFMFQEKPLRVGLIGTGWYGKNDVFRLIQVAPVEVVALCDVDRNQLTQAAKMVSERQMSHKTPSLYSDYRKMLSENQLDIVIIGTPDHWHALTAIEAMKKGAHVYVQKPISVDVMEGEAMVAAARKYNRVVQVGTQRRSTPHLIEAKKNIVDAGLLGKVSHVDMCCYYPKRRDTTPVVVQTVPDFLDFNMWTGPAPLRQYEGLPHIGWWRSFMEYGNGMVGDICIHMFDATRWMLNLGWPKRITSTGGIYVAKGANSNISDTQSALFEYNDLTCHWQHRTWGTPADPEYPWSFIIYGDKGTLKADVYKYDFIPVGKGDKIHKDVGYEKEKYPEDSKEPRIELHTAPATRLHMLNFLEAIKNKSRPVADIEEGHISTASCILANMSMKTGRPVVYDPVKKIVVGDKELTAMLKRPYRGPWLHPEAARV